MKLLLLTKDPERLPTAKPKRLFCPLQVSGSEGISGISSEGERQQLEAPGSWPPWGPVLDSSHQDHPSSSRTAVPRLLDRGDLWDELQDTAAPSRASWPPPSAKEPYVHPSREGENQIRTGHQHPSHSLIHQTLERLHILLILFLLFAVKLFHCHPSSSDVTD